MAKRSNDKSMIRKQRRLMRALGSAEIIPLERSKFGWDRSPPPLKPLNSAQAAYLEALADGGQVVILGPAGTGKTWIAATVAADRYRARRIRRIVLRRPNVPSGRSLGSFPGSLQQKFAPWAVPVVDAMRERMGGAAYDIALKHGDIEQVPFEVMRGRTWNDAFVLLDEAQNATLPELKMFLTRLGENCTAVINGDVDQCDLAQESGLAAVLAMIRRQSLPVPVIEFGPEHVVRSDACAMWVRAFAAARL